MCDFTKGIKLCTCEGDKIEFRHQEFYRKVKGELVKIPDTRNDKIPRIYIWRLFRLINKDKEKEWAELGKYAMPSDNIGQALNAEWIALNLNVENCFDFNYNPQEGDNLFIQQNVSHGPYISFIYKSNEWIVDHYDPFNSETVHIKDGILIPVN